MKGDPGVRASLWVGSEAEMAVVAAVGDGAEEARGGARIELGSLPNGARERLFERRPAETDPVDAAPFQEVLGYVPKVGDAFVTPLRIREELTGAIVVASVAPLSRENREALETLGAEVALALENTQSKEQLAHQAFYDPLTDLPNRALLMDRLERALTRADRRGGSIALLFLDLNGFKAVNDSLGHEAGDRLLVAVAQRTQACMRAEDTAARLGGDEFIILLEEIEEAADATHVAERIAQALQAPLSAEDQELSVTASIGIAISAPGKDQPDDLLRNADAAVYRAKERREARYMVFEAQT